MLQHRHLPPIGGQASSTPPTQFPNVPSKAWEKPKPPPQPGYGPGGRGNEKWSLPAPNKPEVADGDQKKHIPGNKKFIHGRSVLTHPDPQALVNQFAGTGTPANNYPPFKEGYKERVNFGQVIGTKDGKPTTMGIISYDGEGKVHIIPSEPKP